MKTNSFLRFPQILLVILTSMALLSCDDNPVDNDDDNEGRVAFWTDVSNEGTITISLEGVQVGSLTSYFTSGIPACGESGTLTLRRPAGTYLFTATSAAGSQWEGTVNVKADDCATMRLFKGSGQPGTGTVSFWSDIGNEGTISIWVDGSHMGGLTRYFLTTPQCGQLGTLSLPLSAGTHTYSALSESGTTWNGTVQVTADRCVTFRLYR